MGVFTILAVLLTLTLSGAVWRIALKQRRKNENRRMRAHLNRLGKVCE